MITIALLLILLSKLSLLIVCFHRDGLLESAVVSKTFHVTDVNEVGNNTDSSNFFDTTDVTTDTDTSRSTVKLRTKRRRVFRSF